MQTVRQTQFLSEFDLHLFGEGTHYRTYEKLGAHPFEQEGVAGTHFSVWAPNAESVSVMGDFNGWDTAAHPLTPCGASGIWAGFIPEVENNTLYKFAIRTKCGKLLEKMDPYAFASEVRPNTASKVFTLAGYEWKDEAWLAHRKDRQAYTAPMSIYEVHLGSWMRNSETGAWLSYRELAEKLSAYVKNMGYTHIELLPISEHPLDASWGYQTVGYYAPTSRFGSPHDFMYFVDRLHQEGIGVLLDWVPAHFPDDAHALGWFDGTHLYEHSDPRKGRHQDWGTLIFNYGRREVKNFLISNALFWIDKYHIDGLRVDAVASMLYLDYSRKEGEWLPNQYGGRENVEAIDFIRELNECVYREHPDVLTMAEESTDWGMVSRPTSLGGLGFGYKWDMGWMHDTLKYFAKEPVHRKYHHHELTFRMIYAYTENFMLPLSHDEVVHGKGSLLTKMTGDEWQKFANLRLLYGYMFTQPGKKLLFMGNEIGEWQEWNFEASLSWHYLDDPKHAGLQRWVRDLNTQYRAEPALHEWDVEPSGYEWVDCNDSEQSVLSYVRRGSHADDVAVVVCNFTPVPRDDYRVGVPRAGYWKEVLNSDARIYWGSGKGNFGGAHSGPVAWHQRNNSVLLSLPPLSMVVLKYSPNKQT